MTPIQSDPGAERVQLELFRQASVGKKLSLVRSLSRTTIGLSRRAILRSASNLPDELGFISHTYSSDLAARLCVRLSSMKHVEDRMKSPLIYSPRSCQSLTFSSNFKRPITWGDQSPALLMAHRAQPLTSTWSPRCEMSMSKPWSSNCRMIMTSMRPPSAAR